MFSSLKSITNVQAHSWTSEHHLGLSSLPIESDWKEPPAQSRVSANFTSGCSGLFPCGCWKLWEMEIPQPLGYMLQCLIICHEIFLFLTSSESLPSVYGNCFLFSHCVSHWRSFCLLSNFSVDMGRLLLSPLKPSVLQGEHALLPQPLLIGGPVHWPPWQPYFKLAQIYLPFSCTEGWKLVILS